MPRNSTSVDHSALRFNQAMIIALLCLGFIIDRWWLVLFVGVVMALGTLADRPGFVPLYRWLRRHGLLRPDVIQDYRQPHRFAQGVGASFLALALLAFAIKTSLLAWLLAGIVVMLAGLNLFAGFCLGCALYYWLGRIGAPGFSLAPLSDTGAEGQSGPMNEGRNA
jgi:hypothetical protein